MDRVLHLAPIHGSHRCHAVVLVGRISALGGGGGVAELSRTIFGRTSWLQVEIAGRDGEGGAAQGCLPDNRAAGGKNPRELNIRPTLRCRIGLDRARDPHWFCPG